MIRKIAAVTLGLSLQSAPSRLGRARNSIFRFSIALPLAVFFVFSLSTSAQQSVVTLDPASTNIDFTLGATFHTVHGTFRLKSGQLRFDPSSGSASGAIVIDATSANTENDSRDRKMHADILESARFPEIVFKPASVKNAAFLTPGHQGLSEAEVSGTVRLLGQDHDAVLNISVQPQGDGQMKISTRLSVPYVKWGLKNPSTFVLRVSDTVEVDVQAVVRVKTER